MVNCCAAFSIPSFPGAEGYGAIATGGRGGEVRKVTNLLDYAKGQTPIQGSFRWAVTGNSPKIVVFDVSGIIRVTWGLQIGDNTTIAGQTSPAGITLYNWPHDEHPVPRSGVNGELIFGTNNIIRHLRVRGSPWEGHCIQGTFVQKIIIDHVSCSWAGDETVSFWQDCVDITHQWCTFEESMGYWHGEGWHNDGPMINTMPGAGTPSGNYSVHHCLMTHHHNRCPRIAIGCNFYSDCRNNLNYNASGVLLDNQLLYPSGGAHNVVNNYMKKGVNIGSKALWIEFISEKAAEDSADCPISVYMAGNYADAKPNATQLEMTKVWHPREYGVPKFLADELPTPHVTTHATGEVYDLILEKAGAFPRDSTTRRTIHEVKTGTGSFVMPDTAEYRKWTKIPSTKITEAYFTYPLNQINLFGEKHFYVNDPNDLSLEYPDSAAKTDSDNDGMPDAWESANGLNSGDAADANGTSLSNVFTGVEGYTNIEVYINALAESLVTVPWDPPARIPVLSKYESGSFNVTACPNPFSGRIVFVPQNSSQMPRKYFLNIYDVKGNLVKNINTSMVWDGLDNNGKMMAAGAYYYRLEANGNVLKNDKILKTR
ncbi:MAG: FlgD immunoglobulin-like domain containing protein [bacterium]